MSRAASNALAAKAGRLVVIVGPSGAGKDSVMAGALARLDGLPGFCLARRIITRPGDAGGENHIAATEGEFDRMARSGQLAVSWQANGLSYGVPQTVRTDVAAGKIVLLNGSRAALPAIRAHLGPLSIVLVTASTDIIAARLAARGRESAAEIRDRLDRSASLDRTGADLVIDNSGDLAVAASQLADYLLSLAGQ